MSLNPTLLPSIPGLMHYTPPKGLKTIKPRHALMLQDYMSGMGRSVVAMKYQVTPQTVTNLINDPAIKDLIAGGVEGSLVDLDALLPMAVEAVGDVLVNGNRREKLAAVDKVFRAKNLYKERPDSRVTAEDVMQRIVDKFGVINQFNGPTVVQQVQNVEAEPGQ